MYKAFGQQVRSLRDRAGLTQESLASRLGMSRASIANIEAGRQSILLHQLYAFAAALGVDLNELLPVQERAVAAPEVRALPDDLPGEVRIFITELGRPT